MFLPCSKTQHNGCAAFKNGPQSELKFCITLTCKVKDKQNFRVIIITIILSWWLIGWVNPINFNDRLQNLSQFKRIHVVRSS